MKISKAEEQALRIAARLAREGGQQTLAGLAALEHLPEATVAKLLARLRKGGLVLAVRGRHGGYVLARPGTEISAADVIRALGRPVLEGSGCSTEDPNDPACPHLGNCGLRSVWKHLAVRVSSVLEGMSLEDLGRSEEYVTLHLSDLDGDALAAAVGESRRS